MVLLLSLLPTGWLVPWTNRLSEIVRLPLVPLGDIATSARVWLTVDDSLVATRDEFDLLERERNEYRRLYHASAERVRELEGLVGSLRGLPPVDAVGDARELLLLKAAVVNNNADVIDAERRRLRRRRRHRHRVGVTAVDRLLYLRLRADEVGELGLRHWLSLAGYTDSL